MDEKDLGVSQTNKKHANFVTYALVKLLNYLNHLAIYRNSNALKKMEWCE